MNRMLYHNLMCIGIIFESSHFYDDESCLMILITFFMYSFIFTLLILINATKKLIILSFVYKSFIKIKRQSYIISD